MFYVDWELGGQKKLFKALGVLWAQRNIWGSETYHQIIIHFFRISLKEVFESFVIINK